MSWGGIVMTFAAIGAIIYYLHEHLLKVSLHGFELEKMIWQ